MSDRNFDDLAERFSRNVYGNPKGELRLQTCWRELSEQLPRLSEPGASCDAWDAGGGLGQMTEKLLEQGHRVVLSDISAEMLRMARERLAVYETRGVLEIRQQSVQDQAATGQQFDLVLCHAVLEWVADGPGLLASLAASLKPGAYLSLMFYNLNTLVLSNMIKGNLYKLRDEEFAGHPGGLTPPQPRQPDQVLANLQELGLEVVAKRGVRLCYDLMPRAVRAERSLEDMLDIDWQYGAREPFWALGRYVHILCRKPEKG